MAAQKKSEASQAQKNQEQMDFSVYESKDLRTLRRMITTELRTRRASRERCPDIGTRVKILHGARRGQIGVCALHMANRTLLIQFPGGGMSRVHMSRLQIVEETKTP